MKKKSFEFDQPRARRECYAEIGSSGNFLFFVIVVVVVLTRWDIPGYIGQPFFMPMHFC